MRVNGTDISIFNARQHNVSFAKSDISGKGEWPTSAALPIFGTVATGFKSISVDVIVKGDGREGIHDNISDLLALFQGEVELELDGFSHKYKCVMRSHKETEVSMRRWHKVRLELTGYGYGDSVTESITSGTTLTIVNPGNRLESPCVVSVTPRMGVPSATLTGICRDPYTGEDLPVTLSDLTTGKTVIINGITGKITEDGISKAADVDIWRFPSLAHGENVIESSSDKLSITVTVLPLYI